MSTKLSCCSHSTGLDVSKEPDREQPDANGHHLVDIPVWQTYEMLGKTTDCLDKAGIPPAAKQASIQTPS